MQEFTVHTLIDITESRKLRKEAGFEIEYQQQQNFIMMLQTIGMRANPHYTTGPKFKTVDVESLGFGSEYTGSHTVWTFNFYIEFDSGFTDSQGNRTGLLVEDLNFVPVICNLKETINPKLCVFDTKSSQHRNTVVTTGDDK